MQSRDRETASTINTEEQAGLTSAKGVNIRHCFIRILACEDGFFVALCAFEEKEAALGR